MSSQQGSPDSINTEQELRELYNALDERDRHIEDLESQLEQKNQIEAFAIQEENDSLTVELDKHRDELIKSRDTIADLQIQIKQLRADNRELLDRKEQLEEDVTAHKIQENKLRSQLTQQAKTSEDVKRLRKDSNQQMQRLELENQHLRATIREIEENEDILVNEIDTLVQQKSSYQEHSEELSSKCDELYAELDEKTRVNVELSERNTKLQCDLEAEKEALVICESTWKKRHADAMLEVTKLEEQLEKEMVRLHGKEYETNKIQLSKVQQENQRLISSFQQCVNEKNQAERDLDSAIRALNQSKTNLKEEVALGTRKERMISAKLRRELDKAGEMEKSLVTKCSDLEQQLDDANYRLDKLEQRNSMYEANHGLSEAVCHQQKLEADLRRRDYDIKELNEKLSLEIERRRVLAKTVESIREKGGCDQINEDEIKSALHSEDNVLRSENTELIRQVESLECKSLGQRPLYSFVCLLKSQPSLIVLS
jgi:DNA repair exonuclease SbcCD ATPase subunit